MTEFEQTQHGTADEAEDPVKDFYSSATDEGEDRLNRSWPALLTTGFLSGVEISTGILAYILTKHETGSTLLAVLAFAVGFIALYLAHSELFAEGLYDPIMAIFDGLQRPRDLVGVAPCGWSRWWRISSVGG